ncbi:MAG: M14 family zinc carboxypeptidase [Candidatus Zixiibacteriota bacterium]
MKSKFILLSFLCALILADYSLVNIAFHYEKELAGKGFDIVEADPRFGIKAVANFNDIERLNNLGIKYDIEIDDMEKFYQERLESQSHLYPTLDMGGYRTVEETYEFLDSLYAVSEGLMTEKVSIGTTHNGNDIWIVKISDNASVDEDEPEIYLDALIHAREVITHEILIYYMRWLIDGYGTDPVATYIVDNREIYFVPVVNPDGVMRNQSTDPHGGGMWRKNRRNNGDGTWGVDLNRNFGYEWAYDDAGSSPSTSSETYRGPSAFSEPETQAYRNLANDHEFVTHLNFHSYSGMYLHPWGYNSSVTNPDEDIYTELGAQMGKYNGYPYGDDLLYDANGGTFDWMYGEQETKPKIFSFVPEVGLSSDGFWPSLDRKMPLVLSQQWPCIYMSLAAGSAPLFENFVLSDTTGDGSGFADPNEDIRIHISIKNAGIADAVDIYSKCNPVYGISEVIQDSIFIGDIESFDIANSEMGFMIRVDSSMMLDENCQLEVITMDPNGYYNSDTIEFTVGTPFVIAEYDFETSTGFAASNDWERGIPSHGVSSAYNGEMLLATKLSRDYSNNTLSSITTDTYTLPDELEIARFSFWHWYSTEAEPDVLYDGGNIKISLDGGEFAIIEPDGGYDGVFVDHSDLAGESCFAGSSNGWKKCIIDLTAFIGHDIQFQLDFCSDPYVAAPGWYIDDMMVYGYLPTAIAENYQDKPDALEITIYPNPFNSSINITGEDIETITVYDITGNLIERIDPAAGKWSPSKNLDSGMYFIRVSSDNETASKKVLYLK